MLLREEERFECIRFFADPSSVTSISQVHTSGGSVTAVAVDVLTSAPLAGLTLQPRVWALQQIPFQAPSRHLGKVCKVPGAGNVARVSLGARKKACGNRLNSLDHGGMGVVFPENGPCKGPSAGGLQFADGDPVLRRSRGAPGGGGVIAVSGVGRLGSRAVIFTAALSAGLVVPAHGGSPQSFRKCLPWRAGQLNETRH